MAGIKLLFRLFQLLFLFLDFLLEDNLHFSFHFSELSLVKGAFFGLLGSGAAGNSQQLEKDDAWCIYLVSLNTLSSC